jgi:uncharacterized membrane protein (UPF0127 family)
MVNKTLTNPSTGTILCAVIADSFFSKLAGLMFRKEIPLDTCLILSERYESIINTSIHMLFMRFDIAVIWVSADLKVVDKTIARKWHLAYFSSAPAQHVIELHPTSFKNFNIGDKLILNDEAH